MDNWLPAAASLAVAVLAFFSGRATSKANANAVDIKTFHDLVDKVNALSEIALKLIP